MKIWPSYGFCAVGLHQAQIHGAVLVNPREELCSQSNAAGRRGIVNKAISWQTMTVKCYTQDSFVLL